MASWGRLPGMTLKTQEEKDVEVQERAVLGRFQVSCKAHRSRLTSCQTPQEALSITRSMRSPRP